ncbi:MAG: SH3 domain-containing protein [Anaerolineales bacterium]|nr:SH3 domain-containing protein [Anaerolineales bacterium]
MTRTPEEPLPEQPPQEQPQPEQPLPELAETQPLRLSAARRRREQRRMLIPADSEGRAAMMGRLVRRAYPSVEFFFFAVLGGAMMGAGYILDSQSLLLLGILLAPLMTPWVGLTLATVTGSVRFFIQTLAAMLVSGLLVFGCGVLAGMAARIWLPLTLNQAFVHSRLWWPDLVVLAVGAVLMTVLFVRSEEKPVLSSVILAYELFLPLNAAGFGLGSGVGDVWPQGLLVCIVHLAWALIFAAVTLAILGFRPLRKIAYPFTAVILLASLVAMIELTGLGGKVREVFGLTILPAATASGIVEPAETDLPSALVTSASAATRSQLPSTVQVTGTRVTPSPTRPLSLLVSPSLTASVTITAHATPIWALIHAEEGGGAFLREAPGGNIIVTLTNGDLVQVLSETQDYMGALWVHVIAIQNDKTYEGWIIQSVLITATPIPGE